MPTVTFTPDFLRSPLLKKPERIAVLLVRALSDPSEPEPSVERICQLTGLCRVTVERSLEELVAMHNSEFIIHNGEHEAASLRVNESTSPRVNESTSQRDNELAPSSEDETSIRVAEEPPHRGGGGAKRRRGSSPGFVPPTVDEVQAYLDEKGIGCIDAEYFVSRNTAIGWVYGKQKYPVKSWKHLIATWVRTAKAKNDEQERNTAAGQSTAQTMYERKRDEARRLYLSTEIAGDECSGNGGVAVGTPIGIGLQDRTPEADVSHHANPIW